MLEREHEGAGLDLKLKSQSTKKDRSRKYELSQLTDKHLKNKKDLVSQKKKVEEYKTVPNAADASINTSLYNSNQKNLIVGPSTGAPVQNGTGADLESATK